jgi:hypothetical protein
VPKTTSATTHTACPLFRWPTAGARRLGPRAEPRAERKDRRGARAGRASPARPHRQNGPGSRMGGCCRCRRTWPRWFPGLSGGKPPPGEISSVALCPGGADPFGSKRTFRFALASLLSWLSCMRSGDVGRGAAWFADRQRGYSPRQVFPGTCGRRRAARGAHSTTMRRGTRASTRTAASRGRIRHP